MDRDKFPVSYSGLRLSASTLHPHFNLHAPNLISKFFHCSTRRPGNVSRPIGLTFPEKLPRVRLNVFFPGAGFTFVWQLFPFVTGIGASPHNRLSHIFRVCFRILNSNFLNFVTVTSGIIILPVFTVNTILVPN